MVTMVNMLLCSKLVDIVSLCERKGIDLNWSDRGKILSQVTSKTSGTGHSGKENKKAYY